jgi:hypothetical protein
MYIKIKIRYSLDFETHRVFETIKKLNWYDRYGYKVCIPRALQKSTSLSRKNLTKQDIKKAVSKEYNKENYKKISEKLHHLLVKTFPYIAKKFTDFNLRLRPAYVLFLTRYGTNGSYDTPNVIIVNFWKKSLKRILNILIHEMIHLTIEKSVIKHKLTHAQKERRVGFIFAKIRL